jgi:hypothetical protein
MDALYSALFYTAVLPTLVGLFSLIRPLRWVGILTRRRGVLAATIGAVLALGTTVLQTPARTTKGLFEREGEVGAGLAPSLCKLAHGLHRRPWIVLWIPDWKR